MSRNFFADQIVACKTVLRLLDGKLRGFLQTPTGERKVRLAPPVWEGFDFFDRIEAPLSGGPNRQGFWENQVLLFYKDFHVATVHIRARRRTLGAGSAYDRSLWAAVAISYAKKIPSQNGDRINWLTFALAQINADELAISREENLVLQEVA